MSEWVQRGHFIPPRYWQYASNRLLGARARLLSLAELGLPALVVAPHPDDETLGCGGTIMRKIEAGARVSVVVLSDGSHSHRHAFSPAELCALRAAEVRQACGVLGVDPADLRLLGFPDQALALHRPAATTLLAAILAEQHPAQLFVPYRHEPPADHQAAYQIALAARAASGLSVTLFEYPVWLWDHWPQTGCASGLRSVVAGMLAELRLARTLDAAVWVGDLLARKRLALEQHRSQIQRLVAHLPWPTLADVAGGAFLDCFFQPYELFRCTQ